MENLIELTSKQLNQIENKSANIGLFIRIALYTGLRYSSISNIKFTDIAREGNHYYINITKMKRQKTTQKVRISKDIYLRIVKHQKQSKYNNFVIEGIYSNKALSIQYINRILNYYLKVSCHKLRHTFALVNKLNGTDIDLISVCLFHKSINTTMIYATKALNLIRLYGRKFINDYILQMKKYVCIMEN